MTGTEENKDLTTIWYVPDGEKIAAPIGSWVTWPPALEKVVVDARVLAPKADYAVSFEAENGEKWILVFESEERLRQMVRNSRAEGAIKDTKSLNLYPRDLDLSDLASIVPNISYPTFYLCRLVDGDKLIDTNVVYADEGAGTGDAREASHEFFENHHMDPDDYEMLITGPYPLTWSK